MGGTTHLETDVEEPFSEVEWWIQQKNLVAGMTKLWAWRTRVSAPFARCGPKDIYHRSTIGRSMHCKPMFINNKTITQMAEIQIAPVSRLQNRLEHESDKDDSVADGLGGALAVDHGAARMIRK